MKELTIGDWALIAFALMGMMFFTAKIVEAVSELLYVQGWCRWKYSMRKDRKDLAIDNLARAFNLSKHTIGGKHIMRLTHGYSLIIISDEEAKRIWAEADAKQEETQCGTSSTTAP